nr:FG-GAP repeat protein [Deltaproteobacteria bacterium]
AVFRGLPTGETTLLDAAWTIDNNLAASAAQIRWTGAGDLSGDGAADLLVERTLEGGGAEAVLLTSPFDDVGSLGESSTRLTFPAGAEALTWAVVGDVTGDGTGDVLAGDPVFTDFAEESGKVWVFSGPLVGFREESSFYAVIRSTGAREGIGGALAAADVDGDGIGDAVLGATVEHVYVLAGPLVGAPIVQQDWSALWTYDPEELLDSSVFTGPVWTGDATGDGHADLLFGSQDLRLVEGPLEGELSEADVVAMLPGGTQFSVGDVDADGLADLLTGDPTYDPGVSAREGLANLYYGPMSGTLEGPHATFTASAPQDELGTAVALGDGDGDGRDDLAIGVPGLDAQGLNRGAVLLFAAQE